MNSNKGDSRTILFLCTGNSCRSQMAEGFAKQMNPGGIRIVSAGIAPVGINPMAVRVMQESGVDIGSQNSKGISSIPMMEVNTVITLCGHANEHCPTFPRSIERHHWPIDDPVRVHGTEEEVLRAFRKARDEIRDRVKSFMEKVENG